MPGAVHQSLLQPIVCRFKEHKALQQSDNVRTAGLWRGQTLKSYLHRSRHLGQTDGQGGGGDFLSAPAVLARLPQSKHGACVPREPHQEGKSTRLYPFGKNRVTSIAYLLHYKLALHILHALKALLQLTLPLTPSGL